MFVVVDLVKRNDVYCCSVYYTGNREQTCRLYGCVGVGIEDYLLLIISYAHIICSHLMSSTSPTNHKNRVLSKDNYGRVL